MTLNLEQPLRHPDTSSTPLMTKRARWLVVGGFLIPGSAQLLAGSRRLGRFGLCATILLVCAGVVAALGFMFARETTLSILTESTVLLVLQGLIIGYAVLWIVLGFDTLRLTRLVRVQRGWRLPTATLSILLTLAPALAAAWVASAVDSGRNLLGELFRSAPAVEAINGRYNILLLGADAGSDREGLRPDSISLVSVDANTGQSVIIGLPRELVAMPFPKQSPMHELHPGGYGVAPNAYGELGGCNIGDQPFCRLNALYAETMDFIDEDDPSRMFGETLYPDAASEASEPGIEATKDAVTGATGLTVQFYVIVNMEGFSNLIDALGGVTINVAEELPIGGRIDEYSGQLVDVQGWISPGKQHMDGFTAQWYARSRYGSATGDYSRMERQRQLQAAILAQMKPQNVLMKFQEVAAAGTQLLATDIPDSMLGRFVDLAVKARDHAPVPVELVPPEVMPDSPDYDVIQQRVAEGVTQASPPQEKTG